MILKMLVIFDKADVKKFWQIGPSCSSSFLSKNDKRDTEDDCK
jgi:hypothetical protein